MKKAYFITTFILFLLTFVSLDSFAQEKVDFRINLDAGACFEVESAIISVSENNMVKKESKNEVTTVVRYQVVKKTSDFYRLNFMYTDFYSVATGIKEFTIDPKSADALNIFDGSTQVSMMMNKPFSADVSPKGKIYTVKENKEIENEFKQKTKNLSPELSSQISFMVNSFSGNEALVELIESWASYIPDSVVDIGDSWTVRKDSALTRYTFVAETDSTYSIKGVGSKKTTVNNEIMGMSMTVNTEEEYTIAIEIDKHTFLPNIINRESDALITGNMQNNPALSNHQSKSKNILTLKINGCN
ncbi:MAG: DUF6263 family protein [Bacteroidales bacterium]|nr:DUF6263 family protein [Bacteroidales bacterium]